jgi:hypothetical protein
MLGSEAGAYEVRALSRILVLGGYGGFGARLTLRLLRRGYSVLVAGRSLNKATAFCTGQSNAEPVVADRNGDLGPLLAKHLPDLVIDAAGPFQGSDYRVPLACVMARIPYLDLADARSFVVGIEALSAEAIAAGVAVIAGASSVPALSGAVARQLAAGLDRIFAVEISISASKRAIAGASVTAAILSYVGRPIRLWRGRRWDHGFGWQQLCRETFSLSDGTALRGRWLALADVPDLDLMPANLPGRPAVIFRAGTESALQTIGLWTLSWPVRWLRPSALAWLTPLLMLLQRLTRWPSDDRSAMSVRLKGEGAGELVERRWTLLAADGDGPEIPTLAAVILAEAILAGRIAPGARSAVALLSLAEFAPLFATLSLRHEISERKLPRPLYAHVMGERYDALPEMVRRVHRVWGDSGAAGEATVTRGRNGLARLIGWAMGFAAGLEMHICGWSVFGVPLPLALAPQGRAHEWQEHGRFWFDVPISLPLIGLVVHYTGWLEPN